MQLGFPEEYGGVPTDPFFGIIKSEELARHGSGGINASLNSHTIGSPPIALGPEQFATIKADQAERKAA